jgi:hypothetical protein
MRLEKRIEGWGSAAVCGGEQPFFAANLDFRTTGVVVLSSSGKESV